MITISMQTLSNIIFGVFLSGVLGLFLYYIHLWRSVSHAIIAEFWDSTGERSYIVCKKKREMLIDNLGTEIPMDAPEEIKKNSQLVVEIDVPKKHLKVHPALAQCGYYTRRDCVDKTLWPIGSPLPKVPASICSWEVGSSEPIDPREQHRNLPITSSAGFASGVREHDILMQAGMMVDSMQNFMNEMSQKIAQTAKGALGKHFMTVVAVVLGLLIMASIGASIFVIITLQKLGI